MPWHRPSLKTVTMTKVVTLLLDLAADKTPVCLEASDDRGLGSYQHETKALDRTDEGLDMNEGMMGLARADGRHTLPPGLYMSTDLILDSSRSGQCGRGTCLGVDRHRSAELDCQSVVGLFLTRYQQHSLSRRLETSSKHNNNNCCCNTDSLWPTLNRLT